MKFELFRSLGYPRPKLYKRLLEYLKLFPIYLLQKPAGYDLRLYGLMPLIGLATLLKRRRVEIEFWPFILLFAASLSTSLYFGDWLSARRSFQTLCMAGFCSYLIHYFSYEQLMQLAKNALYLLVAYYAYDFCFGIKSHVIILQIWHTYFLVPGLLNNANYTGLLSAGLAIFFGINKNYRLFFIAIISVFLSQSKTAFFCISLTLPLLFITNKDSSKLRFYSYGIFAFIALSPLILYLCEFLSPESIKLTLNAWSGTRYTIQLSFIELFKSAPFGVGYDRSHELIGNFIGRGSSILVNGSFVPYFQDIGAHNTYLKILTELGILGYVTYLTFIFLVLRKGLTRDGHLSVAFMAICASQLMLEGLSEFIFYFFAALIFRASNDSLVNNKACA